MFRHLQAGRARADPISEDFDTNVTLVRMLPLSAAEAALRPEDSGCNSSVECQRHAFEETSFAEPADSEMTDIQQLSSSKSHDSSICSPAPHPASTPLVTPKVPCADQLQRKVDELRRLRPRKFYEICRVHLSFVTDVPADFLQDLIDGCQQGAGSTVVGSPARRGLVHRVCSSVRRTAAESEAATDREESLDSEIVATIDRLIQLLDGRLDAEGIFRKSGQVGRQRQLRQLLQHEPQQLQQLIQDLRCCVHDIATVLKACLGELRQPLLTDRLRPYFLQLAELGQKRTKADENGNSVPVSEQEAALLASRQLRGFRILAQLLPRPNRSLLQRLLRLLRRVSELPRTLMSPENLGTVFGPLLLCPRQLQQPAPQLQRLLALANAAVAYMIRHADDVFKAPEHLALDAGRGLEKSRSRSHSSASCCGDEAPTAEAGAGRGDEDGASDNDDDEAVDLCVSFVDRSAAAAADSREYTQVQVAELYAAVQAMPEGPRKRALVRRFSAAANAGQRQQQQQQQQRQWSGAVSRSPFRRGQVCPSGQSRVARGNFACGKAAHELAQSPGVGQLPSITEAALSER